MGCVKRMTRATDDSGRLIAPHHFCGACQTAAGITRPISLWDPPVVYRGISWIKGSTIFVGRAKREATLLSLALRGLTRPIIFRLEDFI